LKWKSGELQKVLAEAGVAYKNGDKDAFEGATYDGDAFEFLPKWMSQNPLRTK
jgi:hypothetical protein